MARKRVISPEMFTSATVAAWPDGTRWTWVGLICYLDDYGKGEDSPALIKAAVWPRSPRYTERRVAADVDRIVADGSLCRYACCGKPQLHSPTWSAWQKVSHPTPTRLCACPTHESAASRIHLDFLQRDSGATPRNVVQLNVNEGSSSGDPSDQPPSGSDGSAAARAVIEGLKQRKPADDQIAEEVAQQPA